ncbi:unnamed protein product [Cochlearia groenlandica]
MENQSGTLPEDLQIECMQKLPLKSLVKFKTVSKYWKSSTEEKYFKDCYFEESKKKPRMLFVVSRFSDKNPSLDLLIHSVYQEEEPLMLSGQQQFHIQAYPHNLFYEPMRGLSVCLLSKNQCVICNMCAQKFDPLPEIQVDKEAKVYWFFGYAEATKEFKVLCMTKKNPKDKSRGAEEHQVCTVVSGKRSWRRIICNDAHTPTDPAVSLYKDGSLYYEAKNTLKKKVVMRFDMSSEKFSVIQLPEISNLHSNYGWKLVNYKGDVAFVFSLEHHHSESRTIRVCVWKENSRKWSDEERFVIDDWKKDVGIPDETKTFGFEGVTSKGEFVFALNSFYKGSFFVVYYHPVTRKLRKFKVKGLTGDDDERVCTFMDHVDSLMLI